MTAVEYFDSQCKLHKWLLELSVDQQYRIRIMLLDFADIKLDELQEKMQSQMGLVKL